MVRLNEGEIIRGTYEVEKFLGEGAFAEVYRVKHRFLGRQAMKLFKTKVNSVEEVERFLEEALLLSRIGHPNIIRVFDANTHERTDGIFGFFTMEYIAGGSIDQFWRSYGNKLVPLETVVEIIKQVCRGLAVAHGEEPPIIHRDIKPQNVLVGYDGAGIRAKISDFGLAKKVNPLSRLASARGTIAFKAPETIKDFYADSCAGDVWALGTMFYLLLTDRLPYPEFMESEKIDLKYFKKPPPEPSRYNARIDYRLNEVVMKMLEFNQKDRYQDASEVLNDLSHWRLDTKQPKKKKISNHESTKDVLGVYSPVSQENAKKIAMEALKLARESGKLNEAADLMEEAINLSPSLRDKYQYQLQLWRRGISM
ncbi:MAG: protein kinase [Candidatus Dadabacteria bacterium]|nr:protein kinase [Candidatus Dadabacteria bacterium]